MSERARYATVARAKLTLPQSWFISVSSLGRQYFSLIFTAFDLPECPGKGDAGNFACVLPSDVEPDIELELLSLPKATIDESRHSRINRHNARRVEARRVWRGVE